MRLHRRSIGDAEGETSRGEVKKIFPVWERVPRQFAASRNGMCVTHRSLLQPIVQRHREERLDLPAEVLVCVRFICSDGDACAARPLALRCNCGEGHRSACLRRVHGTGQARRRAGDGDGKGAGDIGDDIVRRRGAGNRRRDGVRVDIDRRRRCDRRCVDHREVREADGAECIVAAVDHGFHSARPSQRQDHSGSRRSRVHHHRCSQRSPPFRRRCASRSRWNWTNC